MDELADAIIEDIEMDLRAFGADAATNLRDLLSTPAPPHSEPGEAPHMVTGALRESVSFDVFSDAPGTITLAIGAGSTENAPDNPGFDYAPFLEESMNRPYVLAQAEAWADGLVDALSR
jgi:hypothetical protein